MVERLGREGFHVVKAEGDCRPDIKKIIKKNKIDVVVIDLTELKREGLMILETIHASRAKAEVILMNSPEQLSLSIEGMKLGAFNDYHLPLDMDMFLSGIREAADRKRHRERKTLLRRYQDVMAAVTFAEAGEHEMAKTFLEDKAPNHSAGEEKRKSSNKTTHVNS